MAKRLTEAMVKRLASKHKIIWRWDTLATGLGIKVTPAGTKIWVLQTVYPRQTTQARRTLGEYPAMGIAEARAKATRWRGWVKDGIDPTDAEQAERDRQEAAWRAEALKRGNTFASVAERYIAERTNNRRTKVDAREIRRMLMPAWGDKPIHKITPHDVRELMNKLKARAPYDAKNAWSHAVGIFKMATHEDLMPASPCASLDKKLVFKNLRFEPRQRVLNDREIAALWHASESLGNPYGPFYQVLLLTGVRLNELAKSRWSELPHELRRLLSTGKRVDWSAVPDGAKIWTVPRERFKSGVDHTVVLSNDALRIIEKLPRFADCDWIFTYSGKLPVSAFGKAKRALDKAMTELLGEPVPPWVQHDLRRVVRSNLSALDVADHVAEMCLGHGRKGIERIYDVHRYLPQQRDALERWAAKVAEIVGRAPTEPPDAKVVPLKRA
jgi:hypothetical protein